MIGLAADNYKTNCKIVITLKTQTSVLVSARLGMLLNQTIVVSITTALSNLLVITFNSIHYMTCLL